MYKITTLFAVLILLSIQAFSQTQTINGDFSFSGDDATISSTIISACGDEVEITVTTSTNHSLQQDVWLRYSPSSGSLITDVTITFNPAVDNPRLLLGDFDFVPDSYFEVVNNIESIPFENVEVTQYEDEPTVDFNGSVITYAPGFESETSSWLTWPEDNISSVSFTTTFPFTGWGMQLREYEFECQCSNVDIVENQSLCTESPALEEVQIEVQDGGSGGTWSSSEGIIGDPTATSTTIFGVTNYGIVDIFWMDNCTGETYESQIEYLSAPDAELGVDPDEVLCDGATGTVFVIDPVAGSIYSWDLLCDNQIEEVSTNHEFEIPEEHVGVVCVNITYPNGCTDEAKIFIKRKDCSCKEGLYPGIPDQSVCSADFPICIDVPVGFVLTSVALNDNELIIDDNSQFCPTVAGTYVLDLVHLASGCTVEDLVTISEDTTCCTVVPDISIVAFPGFCGAYQFIDLSTATPTTDILGYNWNFGDGQNSTEQNPTFYYYENEGIYDVTLTVTGIDDQGNCCTESVSQQINVDCPCTNQANFTTSIDDCTVTLSDASTSDFGSTNYNWQWDMGDGTLLFGQNISHTYETSGTYIIELTTTAYDDNEVCQSSTTQSVSVDCGTSIPCDLKPNFLISSTSNYVVFSDDSEVGNGTTILAYEWTVDGVSESTESSLVLSPIPPPGSYNICLDVIAESDGECCIKRVCKIYTVANTINPDKDENDNQLRSNNQSGESELHLFPNPANGYVNVNAIDLDSKEFEVELIKIDGSIAIKPFTSSEVNFDIDISKLNAGIYLLKVQTDKKTLIERLVVE